MKKILLTLLQITVTVVMLYFIFRDPQRRADMANAMRHADLRWVLAAICAAGLSPVVGTVRWGLLLRAQGIVLGWGRVAQIYMIGTFFNLFLIGSTGGDAVKMFYALRENAARGKRAGAILSVVIDRLLGLLALILIAIIFIALRHGWLTGTTKSSALLASFVAIIGLASGALIFAGVVVVFNLADRLPAALPGRAKILELSTAGRLCAQEWRATLAGFTVSLVGHSSFFFTFYFAAMAVHAKVKFWDIAAIMPIVNTIVSLPISMSGVGIRENLFVDLLGDLCGVPAGQAAPISMIGFIASVIFYGLAGGVVYLLYRSQDDAAAAPGDLLHLEEQLERQVEKDTTRQNGPVLPPARPGV